MRPVPEGAPRLGGRIDPQAASGGRIFLNFEGAQLSGGFDDSHADVTQIGECVGPFAPYGDGPKRAAAVQAVREDWAAYDVAVTDARPDDGAYTMCMVGPTNPFGGGVLGIAPIDCGDSQTHDNIVFAFHSVDDGFDASTQATTISQEVAHSYGLEHVDAPGDIMNPFNAGGDAAFLDKCLPIVGGAICGGQHAAQCGAAESQSSHRELLALFGPSAPDEQAPSVAITAPADGSSFAEGASFAIVVAADDDDAIDHVVLSNHDEVIESDAETPFEWMVVNAPRGSYALQVEAFDAAGNSTRSDIVNVNVGNAPAGDETSGSDDGGSDESSSGEGGIGDGWPSGEPIDDSRPDSCACDGGHARTPFALAVLAIVAARRRRRK
jgi:MYXO-CTERM domain-containing protein